VFETTEDVSADTRAALFQPGVKTEMLALLDRRRREPAVQTRGVTPAASR
jgi:hypothetical protein